MIIGALVVSFFFPIGKSFLLQEKEGRTLNELSSRLKEENPTADVGEN